MEERGSGDMEIRREEFMDKWHATRRITSLVLLIYVHISVHRGAYLMGTVGYNLLK